MPKHLEINNYTPTAPRTRQPSASSPITPLASTSSMTMTLTSSLTEQKSNYWRLSSYSEETHSIMSQSSQSQSPSQSQSQSQVLFAIYEDVKPLINLLRAINFAEVCNHIYTLKKEKSHLTNFDLQAWLRSHSSQKATCLSSFILHPI